MNYIKSNYYIALTRRGRAECSSTRRVSRQRRVEVTINTVTLPKFTNKEAPLLPYGYKHPSGFLPPIFYINNNRKKWVETIKE